MANNRHAPWHPAVPLLAAILATSAANAADQLAEPTAAIQPATASPGERVTLQITIPLQPGLHIYTDRVPEGLFATTVKFLQPGPVHWKLPVTLPAAKTIHSLGQTVQVIEPDPATDAVTVTVTGTVTPQPTAAAHRITIALTYQACTDRLCYPPIIDKKLTTSLTTTTTSVGATAPATVPPVSPEKSTGYGSTFSLFSKTIDLANLPSLVSLAVAFLAGIILNIMPCVLPVIPIKILQLAHQAREHRQSVPGLTLIFCLGIVVFFLAFGTVAIVLKHSLTWGQQFQSSIFLIGSILLMIWLALGAFGLYEVRVPPVLAARAPTAASRAGAFAMGVFAGLLSTPCSFALLGAAVAWAQTQSGPMTIVGFGAIGAGMACPYLIIAAHPSLIDRIPTSGRWSELFKQAMGFLLLGVAAFLVSVLPKEQILTVLLYCVLFALVVWLWGQLWQPTAGGTKRAPKALALALLAVCGYYMLRAPSENLPWQALNRQTLHQAADTGQPYLVEFTADWCLNCKTVDLRVFRDRKVIRAIKDNGIILLRADLTRADRFAGDQLRKWTGQSGIPFTVVFKKSRRPALLPGIYSPADLLKAIGAKD